MLSKKSYLNEPQRSERAHGMEYVPLQSAVIAVSFQLLFPPHHYDCFALRQLYNTYASGVRVRVESVLGVAFSVWASEPHTNDERGGLKVNLTLMEYSNLWPSFLPLLAPDRAGESESESTSASHCKLRLRSLLLFLVLPLPRGLSRASCMLHGACTEWVAAPLPHSKLS